MLALRVPIILFRAPLIISSPPPRALLFEFRRSEGLTHPARHSEGGKEARSGGEAVGGKEKKKKNSPTIFKLDGDVYDGRRGASRARAHFAPPQDSRSRNLTI